MTIVISHCRSTEAHCVEALLRRCLHQQPLTILTHDLDLTVQVEVLGGVAEITSCSPGISAEVTDHDNQPEPIPHHHK